MTNELIENMTHLIRLARNIPLPLAIQYGMRMTHLSPLPGLLQRSMQLAEQRAAQAAHRCFISSPRKD